MSGFSNRGAGERKIYANIVNGKLAIKAQKEGEVSADGSIAVTRKNKNGLDVYEWLYSDLEAVLESVEVEKNDTLKAYFYVLTLQIPAGEKVILQIPAESKYGDNFAIKCDGLKMGEMLKIQPFDFVSKEDNRKQIGVSLVQNGSKIPASITKENPKGRPLPSEEKLEEDEWKAHMILVRKFYRNHVAAWANQNAAPDAAPRPTPNSLEEVRQAAINNEVPEDDLPF